VSTDPLSSGLCPAQLEALERYFRLQVGSLQAPLRVLPLAGGQSNPTVMVESGSQRWVVRRKPAGVLLASAHAIDREFRVMQALRESAVPVPDVLSYCDDPSLIGVPFYIMSFVEGRIFTDPALPGVTPEQRQRIYQSLNETIAAIHRLDIVKLGLDDFGRPQGYLARQLDRWTRQYRAAQTQPIPAMEALMRWLTDHLPPADDDPCLVHGDYRIDNVLFHPQDDRVVAVIDWELSTLGHGMADFAYHAMAWRVGADEFRGMRGEDFRALGIPPESEYLQAYCARRGPPLPVHWRFYLAFNMFRMAAILQGILKRALQGNAAAQDALDNGRRAGLMAQAGLRIARGED
jgi:aminoglycoside phosphotransferase (APT) family kinase protein